MPASRPSSLAAPVAAPEQRRVRIAFVSSGLGLGGAEMMLWKLLSRIDRTRFEPLVVSLSNTTEAGLMLARFRQLGVPCEFLNWPGIGVLRAFGRGAQVLRSFRPDIVQGWMYHGNLAATLATAWARLHVPVVWNIRASLMAREHEKLLTALLIRVLGRISFTAAAIVNNSESSAREHARIGYDPAKQVILPNGFDADRFRPSEDQRAQLRREVGAGDDDVLVGLFARYHPMKDHRNFLHAAALLLKTQPGARFVLAGEGVARANAELLGQVRELGLDGHVHLLGPRDDVHCLMAGVDVVVSSSSSGEGFPNVIGEAMCCGVPCVVTAVGESAAVVADTGIVVPPGDPAALAAGVAQLIGMGRAARKALGARARSRALAEYSLDSVVRRYEALYASVLEQKQKGH